MISTYYDFIFSTHSRKTKIILSTFRLVLPVLLTFYSLSFLKEIDVKTISTDYLYKMISGGVYYFLLLYIGWSVVVYLFFEQFFINLLFHPISRRLTTGFNNILKFFERHAHSDKFIESFGTFFNEDLTTDDLKEGEHLSRNLLVITLQITLLSFMISSQFATISFIGHISNITLTILLAHFALNYISILVICYYHERYIDNTNTGLFLIEHTNTSTSKGDKLIFDYMYKNNMPNKND